MKRVGRLLPAILTTDGTFTRAELLEMARVPRSASDDPPWTWHVALWPAVRCLGAHEIAGSAAPFTAGAVHVAVTVLLPRVAVTETPDTVDVVPVNPKLAVRAPVGTVTDAGTTMRLLFDFTDTTVLEIALELSITEQVPAEGMVVVVKVQVIEESVGTVVTTVKESETVELRVPNVAVTVTVREELNPLELIGNVALLLPLGTVTEVGTVR